jgi:hypothetical protein
MRSGDLAAARGRGKLVISDATPSCLCGPPISATTLGTAGEHMLDDIVEDGISLALSELLGFDEVGAAIRAAIERMRAHSVPTAVVVHIAQPAVVIVGVPGQVPVRGVDHLHAGAMRRASVKMLMLAARLHVANVWRMS